MKYITKNSHNIYRIDINALIHNLNYFRSYIKNQKTKIMIMAKAFSYGSGIFQILNTTDIQNIIDYLGVAYIDEGIQLRYQGIKTPILVMNPHIDKLSLMIHYSLEPGIYSFRLLYKLLYNLKKIKLYNSYPIHLKIDTGMHRLGFLKSEILHLGHLLNNNNQIIVKSIFSHLAASENSQEDTFTIEQINSFNQIYKLLVNYLGYFPMRHILNTAGIIKFPQAQYDMVRLGLGAYGISYDKKIQNQLQNIGELTTRISQIKILDSGDTVGYGRKFIVTQLTRIAILPIGYADGIDRRLGYGHGYVIINNYKSYIIGEICMDMMMVNINNINCHEGDKVIIFGHKPTIHELSYICNTTPYELLTSISHRVNRILNK